MSRTLHVTLLLLLSGCTTVLSSSNPVKVDPSKWARKGVTIDVYGALPGRSNAELAALVDSKVATDAVPPSFSSVTLAAEPKGRRIVFYVNAETLPPTQALCRQPNNFQGDQQASRFAAVTSVLCQDQTVISESSGYILAANRSPAETERRFATFKQSLFDVLQPGADDPESYYRKFSPAVN